MEKKREQDFANQEALRLSGVFNTPIPAQPPEREKALDKVTGYSIRRSPPSPRNGKRRWTR